MTTKHSNTLITSKMPGESARQYAAWLLYSEAGSLRKSIRIWEQLFVQGDTRMIPFFGVSMGKPPSLATLKRWSSRYLWQQRTRLKHKEDLADMRYQFKLIRQKVTYQITILMGKMLDKLDRQLDQGMYVSVHDFYLVWKMHRVELGLSVGNYQVTNYTEPKPEPVDPERARLMRRIRKATSHLHIDEQGVGKS